MSRTAQLIHDVEMEKKSKKKGFATLLDTEAVPHELLSYTVNDGWTEQGTGTYDAETGMTKHTYLYDTAVAGQATTASVFDNVTAANYANGQIGANALQNLQVDGYSIQALGFDTAAAAWAAYGAQNA